MEALTGISLRENWIQLVLGPVVQLGERLVRNEEVGGSNPLRSTK